MCHSDTQVHTNTKLCRRPRKSRSNWKERQIKCNSFCLGGFVPVLKDIGLAADGSAVIVTWSQPGTEQRSTSEEELMHYVVEWTSVPATLAQWQKVAKDQHNTSITGKEHLPFRHNDNTQPDNTGTSLKTDTTSSVIKQWPLVSSW